MTPVLAARAGAARVHAITRSTRFGSVDQVRAETLELARLLGVEDRIQVVDEKRRAIVEVADIVTNSGHVRPIDAETIEWMKPNAVIPLMYETWELRPADLDIAACHRKGILIAGTNERHPAVDVFSFLGVLAVRLLHDAGVAVFKSTVLVVCRQRFRALHRAWPDTRRRCGGFVSDIAAGRPNTAYDVVLVAMTPRPGPVLSEAELRRIAMTWPGAVVAQYFGDLDRSLMSSLDLPVWPLQQPQPGHMGILPAEVGPEPTLRLQSGGLKVGEVLWRYRDNPPAEARAYIDQFIV